MVAASNPDSRRLRSPFPPPTHSQAQYVFIHDALEELITYGDMAILSHNLHIDIGNLGRIVLSVLATCADTSMAMGFKLKL